jgi:hypothetical protein
MTWVPARLVVMLAQSIHSVLIEQSCSTDQGNLT